MHNIIDGQRCSYRIKIYSRFCNYFICFCRYALPCDIFCKDLLACSITSGHLIFGYGFCAAVRPVPAQAVGFPERQSFA